MPFGIYEKKRLHDRISACSGYVIQERIMGFRDIVVNIFTSGKSLSYGKYKEEKLQGQGLSDYLLKYILLNFIHVFGSAINILFVFQNIAKGSYFDAAACSFSALVLIIDFFISRTKIPQIVPAVVSSISFGLFCVLVIWNGDAQGAGFIFIFLYPVLTVLLTGMAKGAVFSAVLMVVVIIEFFVPGASHFEYPLDVSLRMLTVYVMLLGSTLVYETSRQNKDKINKKLMEEINKTNKNLQNIVEQRTKKIIKLQNSILKTMSNLVEYRDFATGEHIERTQYSVNLLLDEIRKQNLYAETINDWDTDLILQSVQLHDVGKIAISDLILNKPGKLTEEEYEKMKEHAVFGFKIIERIEADSGESELLNHAKVFALNHHEKWDGTGYPHGLSGFNIPLQGRVMAVADVYDALISDRPYKKAFSREEAIKLIVDGKGTQFDPVLVDLFTRIYQKI
jgi:response regulator RpfG family c-di-GMP phosphodiesterase